VRWLLFLASLSALAAQPLPALRADVASVTVSGLSSGGYMAVQMHVAHSSRVKGAGVIAAGPYYCAQGSLAAAYYNCMQPAFWAPLPDVKWLQAQTEALAQAKRIDATAQLGMAPVWLFSGTQDHTVSRKVVEALSSYYAAYQARIAFIGDKPAGHAMVTQDQGNACSATEAPYINDCHYDTAGALLGHLLGPLAPASAKASGRLLRFDQRRYANGDAHAISLDDEGLVYIPKACDAERCRIHVAFHGCRQNASAIGERFAREAGYNRWADTNRLIVLYPQTVARYWGVFNPRACWDWWGYTGPQYHTKEGAQVRAVKAMLDRLSSN
jgi:poly(3-hydroxybutyrate) depolymerase